MGCASSTSVGAHEVPQVQQVLQVPTSPVQIPKEANEARLDRLDKKLEEVLAKVRALEKDLHQGQKPSRRPKRTREDKYE